MPLLLYADECVDARVVAGLLQRSVDVRTAADEELLGATDEEHMARAQRLGRAVVTSDRDFLKLAHDRWERGESHPGVLFILPRTSVGVGVRRIALLAHVLDQHELEGRIDWIG